MSSPTEHYSGAGGYPNSRRSPFQPTSGSQPRFPELSAPSNTTNANQDIAYSYDLVYPSPVPIDGRMNPYGTPPQYPQEYGSGYHQHPQGVPYPGQNWTQGHYPNAGFVRSASWSPQHVRQPALPQHTGHSVPPTVSYGFTSMNPTQNIRERSQVVVPQRSYVPHHRQNYLDQFIPENPITFPHRYGGDGIALTDALSENFDNIVGRDDAMFANYPGPAISLRLEWPGYKSWTKQIKTKDWRRDPQPITKAKLAIEVAKKVQTFIQDNINEPMTPGGWPLGPGFTQVDDLVLVRLVHVSKGSWQAEFRAFQ